MNIKELRKYRFQGIALFDLIASFLVLLIIFLIMWKIHWPQKNYVNFVVAAILLTIPIGIFFHLIFGINTRLNNLLGLSDPP